MVDPWLIKLSYTSKGRPIAYHVPQRVEPLLIIMSKGRPIAYHIPQGVDPLLITYHKLSKGRPIAYHILQRVGRSGPPDDGGRADAGKKIVSLSSSGGSRILCLGG